jgi:hypothetical protein
MAHVLLCRKCGHWYQVVRQIPDICPHCEQSASWTTDPDPDKPFKLTENDKKFLRSIRIATNNDHEEDGA